MIVLVPSEFLTQLGRVIETRISALGKLSGNKSSSIEVLSSALIIRPESKIFLKSSVLISLRNDSAVESSILELTKSSRERSNSWLVERKYTG